LIGLLTKRLTGLPWVADFRDPWRANPFRSVPYKALDHYDAWLEKQVIHGADRVVCNTDSVRADFQLRYPALASRFVTVFNGFDPEDYVGLEARRPPGVWKTLLTHAGNFYGPRSPDALFQSLRLLRRRSAMNDEVCLQLLGIPTYHGRSLRAIAAEYGVEDMVLVQGDVPHRQALEMLRGSEIQVLVGFSGTGADLQVPGKLFEYFGTGRPILALAPRQSAIADIMTRAGNPGEVCEPGDPEGIARAIERMAAKAKGSPDSAGAGNCPDFLRQFHRREQIGQIADLLESTQAVSP
jgi:glycosyltransferase involved in cell wall biosynthesis